MQARWRPAGRGPAPARRESPPSRFARFAPLPPLRSHSEPEKRPPRKRSRRARGPGRRPNVDDAFPTARRDAGRDAEASRSDAFATNARAFFSGATKRRARDRAERRFRVGDCRRRRRNRFDDDRRAHARVRRNALIFQFKWECDSRRRFPAPSRSPRVGAGGRGRRRLSFAPSRKRKKSARATHAGACRRRRGRDPIPFSFLSAARVDSRSFFSRARVDFDSSDAIVKIDRV